MGIRGIGYALRGGAPDLSDIGLKLDEAERLGVDYAEVPGHSLDLMFDGKPVAHRVAALKRAFAGRRVKPTYHGPIALNLMDEPERLAKHEQVLAASIDIAADLGSPHLIIHTGFTLRPAADVEAAFARQREALSRAAEHAAAAGVVVCVETLFKHGPVQFTATPSRLATEIEAVGHPNIAVTLDFSHAFQRLDGHHADYIDEIAPLIPLARHLHVHDSFGHVAEMWTISVAERLAYGIGDLHMPVGWGALPWEAIAGAGLYRPDAIVVLELDGRFWSELPAEVDKLRRFAANLTHTPTRAAAE